MDQAEQRALQNLTATLEPPVAEAFDPDHATALARGLDVLRAGPTIHGVLPPGEGL